MKFSASAALILLACVVYVTAYGTHRPTTHRPTYHPTRPTHRPTYRPTYRPTHRPTYHPTHRPTYRPMKNIGNSNVNINDNKNSNDNVDIASLLSQLFGDEEIEFPCTSDVLCYDKKKNLIKSGAAAVDAKKAEEPTEKVVEKSAAPAVVAPAVAPAADVNFDQFANFAAEFQDDDVIFAVPSEMDEGDDDFFA